MDDIVRQAMAKWPDVPAAYGWLSLDRRGIWLIKDEQIGNAALLAFIARNYARDDDGRWFFQNGPQRVFVRLRYAPWVLRLTDGRLATHTGLPVARLSGVWFDEDGVIVLETEHGPGTLDDRDAADFAALLVDRDGRPVTDDILIETLENSPVGRIPTLFCAYAGHSIQAGRMPARDVPARLGFVRDPVPEPCRNAP